MIRLTVSGSLDAVCDFIDNRLVLRMSEKKLRQTTPIGSIWMLIKEKYRLKSIDNTILYTERDQNRVSLVVTTNEKVSTRIKSELFGISLRKKGDSELELYIDTLKESFNKGILTKDMIHGVFKKKYLMIGVSAAILIATILATGGALFVLIVLMAFVAYPVQFLIYKKRFAATQQKMNTLLSLFEAEFQTTNKVDSKDSITFFGKVKSDGAEALKDIAPFTY